MQRLWSWDIVNGKQVSSEQKTFLAFFKVTISAFASRLRRTTNILDQYAYNQQPRRYSNPVTSDAQIWITNATQTQHLSVQVPHKKYANKLIRIQVRESKAGRPVYLVITLPCRSTQNNSVNVESNLRLPGATSCSVLS
jgi:phosphoribosylpyrophosphate synthetase